MTEEEKFEERIRTIVRDEMEAEWLEINGYADQVRHAAFNMCRAIITANCEQTIKSFAPGGPQDSTDHKGQ
jgi:hypothetical protein